MRPHVSVLAVGQNLGPPWNEGLANLVREHTAYLASEGIETTTVTSPSVDSGTLDESRGRRLIEVPLPMRRHKYKTNPINHTWFYLALLRLLPKLIRGQGHPLVHLHLWGSPFLAPIVRAAKKAGSPTLWSVHSRETLNFLTSSRSRLFNSLDAVTYPTEGIRELLVNMGADSWRVHHLPTTVDSGRYRPLSTVPQERSRLGLPSDKVLFVYAGHIRRERGPEVAVRAFLNAGVDESSHLVIADSGMGSERLRARIGRLVSRSRSLSLLGFQERIEALFGCADVLLFPLSNNQAGIALPRTVLEAMSSEMAVVSTGFAGVDEIITDGVDGLIVPAATETDFVDRIRLLAGDEELRFSIGKNARRTVAGRYSMDAIGRRLLNLYFGCVEDSQGGEAA